MLVYKRPTSDKEIYLSIQRQEDKEPEGGGSPCSLGKLVYSFLWEGMRLCDNGVSRIYRRACEPGG